MKYVNQINTLLAILGVGAVVYTLSQTYFNPSAQPKVVLELSAAPEAEGPPADRGSAPGPASLSGGSPGAAVGEQTRPPRNRTRPANTLRESSAPPTGRPEFRSQSASPPRGTATPNRPTAARPRPAGRDLEEDNGFNPDPAASRPPPVQVIPSAQRPPAQRGAPAANQPPPDKRETPPPPARTSMPEQ